MCPSADATTRAPFRVVRDHDPLIVLIDDVRMFKDGRAQVVAQSVDEALDALDRLHDRRIDELWLDYDIVGGTSQPVVDRLVTLAEQGFPADIGRVFVHSSRVPEGLHVTQALARAGYRVERNYAQGIWSRRTHSAR
jgi:hypothetical protein